MPQFPYAGRYGVNRALPEKGMPRDEVLQQLETMAKEEDEFWETGKVSGTMYCGDHEHYAFMNEAFGRFAHVNALQRDICPSETRFEGEIIAMTLDMLHADAVTDTSPSGWSPPAAPASILHAVLAYREHGRDERGSHDVERDQARDRASRVRQGVPPVRRRACARRRSIRRPRRSTSTGCATTSTTTPSPSSARRATTATARSTRSSELSDLALRDGRRPARRRLPRRVHPAVRAGARLRRSRCSTSASRA